MYNKPVLKVGNLKTEHSKCPTLNIKTPHFSWEILSDEENSFQKAYRIQVSSSEKLEKNILWDSGRIESDQTTEVLYGGKPLKSDEKYFWRVFVWDNNGNSAVSGIAFWRTGIKDWTADWITPDLSENPDKAPLLRKVFNTEKCLRATLYVFSQGWYEAYINGAKADDRVLAPGYSHRYYYYDSYEITDKIKDGENCIGFWLGAGYYKKNFSKFAWRWNGPKRILAELHLIYEDGSRRIIPTDDTWRSKSDSSIYYNHIYHGEYFDSRLCENWFDISYDDSAWEKAETVYNKPQRILKPSVIEPLKITEEIRPVSVWKSMNGTVLDFGENIAGWARLKFRGGKSGTEITVRYAEEIDENGDLDTYTNRKAQATDKYILNGSEQSIYEPRFTYHGFRYIEIIGYDSEFKKDDAYGCVVRSSMEKTGSFSCNYEPLNRLFNNISRSVMGNSYSIMTDCPARDERTPCLMDSATYPEMSAFLLDAWTYWRQWLTSYFNTKGTPDWEGTQILIAWSLYNEYGDTEILKSGYRYFKECVFYIRNKWKDLIIGEKFGDWCAPKEKPDGNYRSSFSNIEETSTALYYREVSDLIKIAEVLGCNKDIKEYKNILNSIALAYNKRFFNDLTNDYSDGSLTASVLPLYFGMVPKERENAVYESIKRLIADKGGHLDTGIFGTKYLSLLLSENNDIDLLLQTYFKSDYPSFGYQFSKGATTLWEQWSDAKGDMISHNHAMFAGAGVFIVKVLSGLVSLENAYKKVKIEPHMSSFVNRVKCVQHTVRGVYSIEWNKNGKEFSISVEIPFNCSADVVLPNGVLKKVFSGRHTFECEINV